MIYSRTNKACKYTDLDMRCNKIGELLTEVREIAFITRHPELLYGVVDENDTGGNMHDYNICNVCRCMMGHLLLCKYWLVLIAPE